MQEGQRLIRMGREAIQQIAGLALFESSTLGATGRACRGRVGGVPCGQQRAVAGHELVAGRGEFIGIAATGKEIAVGYIDIWRVEASRLVENWVQLDTLGLLQQLGSIPTPGQ